MPFAVASPDAGGAAATRLSLVYTFPSHVSVDVPLPRRLMVGSLPCENCTCIKFSLQACGPASTNVLIIHACVGCLLDRCNHARAACCKMFKMPEHAAAVAHPIASAAEPSVPLHGGLAVEVRHRLLCIGYLHDSSTQSHWTGGKPPVLCLRDHSHGQRIMHPCLQGCSSAADLPDEWPSSVGAVEFRDPDGPAVQAPHLLHILTKGTHAACVPAHAEPRCKHAASDAGCEQPLMVTHAPDT